LNTYWFPIVFKSKRKQMTFSFKIATQEFSWWNFHVVCIIIQFVSSVFFSFYISPWGSWYQCGEGGKACRKVKMVQILCTYECKWKKIILVEAIPGMRGEGRKRRMVEGMNSSMIYCKNLCKCHNVPSSSTTINK
jgi:hypothetical protein